MPQQKNDQRKKGKSRRGGRPEDTSWIDTDKVVNRAQRIVSSAVNVLEEEIAAGILAAKRIEKKLIDVEEIRSNPDDLINRIRRDSHEALDLYIDAFASVSGKLNTIIEALKSDPAEKPNTTGNRSQKQKPDAVVLEPDGPLKPGESCTLSLIVYEDNVGASGKVSLRKSDLVGPNNQVVSQRAITIMPKTLMLKGQVEKEISINVKLPRRVLPGIYNALLTDIDNPLIRMILAIQVTQ